MWAGGTSFEGPPGRGVGHSGIVLLPSPIDHDDSHVIEHDDSHVIEHAHDALNNRTAYRGVTPSRL